MRKRILMAIALLIVTGVTSARVSAQKKKEKDYDLLSSNITGDVLRGQRRIVAQHLNVLRYDYRFSSTITFSQVQDLWSKLTALAAPSTAAAPPTPTTPQVTKAKAVGLSCEDQLKHDNTFPPGLIQDMCQARGLEGSIDEATSLIADLARQASDNRQEFAIDVQSATCATNVVAAGGKALTDFLRTTTGDPEGTIAGIATELTDNGGASCTSPPPPGQDSAFISGTKVKWADLHSLAALAQKSGDLQAKLDQQGKTFPPFSTNESAQIALVQHQLQSDSDALGKGSTFNATTPQQVPASAQELQKELTDLGVRKSNLDAAASLLNWATGENSKIVAGLPDIEDGGQKYLAFRAAQDLLLTWKVRMSQLKKRGDAYKSDKTNNTDPFSEYTDADCEFAFSRTKTTAVSLTRVDLMPGSTATSPETVLSVSVECTSPFTVSGGVAFSTIAENEFGIQPVATPSGSTTTTNQFVSTVKSSFRPAPLGMIHARLWEPTDWFSLHASFGISGNFSSQNSGGSSAEFLLGPSIGFFRTMFLSPGLYLGRQVLLGGGFKVGDPVPPNIKTPPLQKSYTPAFGFAITFTKP